MPLPVNASCNFNCTFCDKQWSKEDAVDPERVLRDAPMSELSGLRAVLGGGEPTLHPKLPVLLEGLRAQKVRRIAIRSNGAWASRKGPVTFLKQKGLSEVTLLIPTDDPVEFDAMVRKKGAYDAVMAGVANLIEARVRISVRVPLLQPTLPRLPEILQNIPKLIPSVRRIDLCHIDIDDPALQVRYEDLNAVLPFGSDHPWPNVPKLFLDPGPGVALCRAAEMSRWNFSPDDETARRHHPPGCNRCYLKRSCPGVLRGVAAVFGDDVVRPYALDFDPERPQPVQPKTRTQKTPFESVKGVTYECPEDSTGPATLASVRLRVGHQCNRRCTFCFIPHHEKSVQDHDIRASIEAAVERGVRELVMTGGEPTLQADLPEYIEQAKQGGVRRIVLQTNGIRLADPTFCNDLASRGLTHVVISLHAHSDEVLGKITGLPNTMHRILRGMDNLDQAGLQVSVTHVVTPENYAHMPEFVRFMVENSPVRRFCFIYSTPMAWPMAKAALIPRYADTAPYLMKALDYCVENGVLVDGLSFKCGVPHCVVGGEPKYLVGAVKIPESNRTNDWMQVPACKVCVLRDQCYGVRRLYAWMYGVDEFKPVLDSSKRVDGLKQALPIAGPTQPAQGTVHSGPVDVAGLMRRAAAGVGLGPSDLARIQATTEVFELTLRGPDGAAVRALRVRMGGTKRDHLGGIAVTEQLDAESCRTTAFLRHLRAAALGIDLSGAHGQLELAPGTDATRIYAQYVQSLHHTRTEGIDYITPHTSSAWRSVEAAVDQLNATRPAAEQRVGVLRRTLPAAFAALRMSSVTSAVAAAVAALSFTEVSASARLAYAVWGYGRAGQAFAARMDRVLDHAGRRPLLVGCADTSGSWVLRHGLEHERATAFKQRNGRIPAGKGHSSDPSAVLRADADLLLLSGRGPAFTATSAATVKARVVVDLTGTVDPNTERALVARGVTFVPSPISTAGPTILAELERRGPLSSVTAAQEAVGVATRDLLIRTLKLADQTGLLPTEALVGIGLSALAQRQRERGKTPPSDGASAKGTSPRSPKAAT